MLDQQSIDKLVNLADIEDESFINQLRLLASITPPTFYSDPELFIVAICRAVDISVLYGNSLIASFLYAWSAIIFSNPAIAQYETAYFAGKVALGLLEKYGDNIFRCKVINNLNGFVFHYKEPLRNSLPELIKGYQTGVDYGDLTFAGYCVSNYIRNLYASGAKLDHVIAEADKYIAFIKKIKHLRALSTTQSAVAAIRYLHDPEKSSFQPNAFAIAPEEVEAWEPGKDNMRPFLYNHGLLTLALLFGCYAEA